MNYTFNETEISDLHKDAYGFRPSHSFWLEWQASSMDEKQAIWDSMIQHFNEMVEADLGDMDGDHASALASAGWGTDEDYGGSASDW